MSDNEPVTRTWENEQEFLKEMVVRPAIKIAEYRKWYEIADEMYGYLAQEWCWHCGATLANHYKVDEILNKYREAFDDRIE
jgi:ribosomal protein S27AE